MERTSFVSLSKAVRSIKVYGPGEDAKIGEFKPGDFILTHGNSVFSHLIRFGQAIRFVGKDRKYTWWNHAALIASNEGNLIEALGAGVLATHLSDYKPTQYHLVSLKHDFASDRDREQTVKFAGTCLGMGYDYLDIVSIALSLLTGCKLSFGFDGRMICSGLVAQALERTNAIFNRSPSHIMPADLAKYFGVEPPPPGTNKGEPPRR
ncbi:MAG: hypothetical protein WB930_08470 [Syntrophobacteraceae bacterium]